jgi:hypothetical protein
MQRKESERSILRLIYDESVYAEVLDYERPDFLLRHYDCPESFGVEVTELYHSGTSARLHNLPDYLMRLIDGGTHLHHDDVGELKVAEAKLYNPDGSVAETTLGVMYKSPSVAEMVRRVISIIENKSDKFLSYLSGLSHVNLIICNREDTFFPLDIPGFHRYFITDPLKRALARAPFREIFFISEMKDRTRYYFPLKLCVLFSEFVMFRGAFYSIYQPLDWMDKEDRMMNLFALVMQRRGYPVYLFNHGGALEVVLGQASLRLNGEGVQLSDYRDIELPLSLLVHPKIPTEMISFHEYYLHWSKGQAFESGLAVKTRSTSQIAS